MVGLQFADGCPAGELATSGRDGGHLKMKGKITGGTMGSELFPQESTLHDILPGVHKLSTWFNPEFITT